MRRAREEFHCIECAFDRDPKRPMFFHVGNCSRGLKMGRELLNKRLDVWAEMLQKILDEEETFIKPSERCSVCRTRKATGTVWVAYHDDSKALFILSNDILCDDCSLNVPKDWVEGRRWGFARIITKKNWELMDYLERDGVA